MIGSHHTRDFISLLVLRRIPYIFSGEDLAHWYRQPAPDRFFTCSLTSDAVSARPGNS
jgi:hypothetical protein